MTSLTARLLVVRTAVCVSALVALAASQGAVAQTDRETPQGSTAAADLSELRAKLRENVPELRIDDIRTTPVPHLYAVISGRSTVLYVDETGTFVLNGHMFRAKGKDDLTRPILDEIARIDPKSLPLDDSLAEVRGNGKRQLYVFSDPDCPYCKKLEQELPDISDVTIHVFLFPLVSLHPNAKENAERVWCASDPSKAWHDKVLNDIVPPEANCANPIARNLALGEKLGINATPTLIFGDGTVVAGAIPVQKIEALLDARE